MRVLVDYRPALRARTGVGEYMHELVRAYTASHPADDVAVFTSSWADRPAPGTAETLHARVVDRRVPVAILNLLWHRAEWPPVEWLAGEADVVHAAHPLLIPSARAARVVTVHDLFFLSHPERTTAEIRRDYAALAASHARRADAVVAVSQYTRRQVIERLGVDAARVHVCSSGARTWTRLGHGPNVPADGYVLFIGTLEPRKNLGVLLDAYERLAAGGARVPPLRIAGGTGPGANAWLDRVAKPPLDGLVRYVGYVADDAREALYAGARTLVLPSLDEGFGLPALEAMSAGVPVIAANAGALPEVVGDAAVLFNPADPDALAYALSRLATDEAWAIERAAAGLLRARAYTWDTAARALGRIYDEAIARRTGRAAA
ncbi:MAG TPA: glycosyltransferase family 1 protein [Vicinamibacterales bacterium]|nr:glycosyltransferase family 1 protein [Vicinamibacterales bacterium]